MTPQEFKAKWAKAVFKERTGAHQHFLDLCHMLGQPTPAEVDAQGASFTFEKRVSKTGGGQGFADVWKREHFAWEYKSNNADLGAAYQQLLRYREALENPPLLVVSDFQRFEIHTNFTNTAKRVYAFTLDELDRRENLAILRALFTEPEKLRPTITPVAVTEEAAEQFGLLARSLQARGVNPQRAAHFLVQILFCLFAEDVGLLPDQVFSGLLEFSARRPEHFPSLVSELFHSMRDGGVVAYKEIAHFNGGLFDEIGVEPLMKDELALLARAAKLDWSNIEPAIFGTLFERSLDPSKRAQLGAHYTGRADIERVVEPVIMMPLRRRWKKVREEADKRKADWEDVKEKRRLVKHLGKRDPRVIREEKFGSVLKAFQEELARIRILDPACGSGNFLYVALDKLKDLEKEVISYATASGLSSLFPRVDPGQLYGLELDDYARELAQVVIWIGHLQWMTANGFQVNRDPVLKPLDTVRLQDALLDRSDPEHPKEATWPAADFIIGNPPFLGGKRLRTELGDGYVDVLFRVYGGRVPRESDLVCYFFEKARMAIAEGRAKRAGLLATNSIRGGANRKVLERIKQSGDIFMAWDDEPWILDGAAVRISIVGFDDGGDLTRTLDGAPVVLINPDLTASVDLTIAKRLPENVGIAFMGDTKGGTFDIPAVLACEMLAAPINPNGRPNSDVVVPWVNGLDLTRRPRGMWIIDFGVNMRVDEAALYEQPFEFIQTHVWPVRKNNNRAAYRERWWLHVEPRPAMRHALNGLSRFICTPRVATYRLFVWLVGSTLPDSATIAFARDDDYFFGVLHSRAHELWSLRMGTSLEDRPRYTPTTCFETFPLPWPPGQEPMDDPRVQAIAEAARKLNEQRERWLNPEGASEAELKKRTLTNLYNARPTWLVNAHAALDRAVWAAYGWDDPDPAKVDEDVILARLLQLNLERRVGLTALESHLEQA